MSGTHPVEERIGLSTTRRRWRKGLHLGALSVVLLQVLFALSFCLFATDLMTLPPGTPIRPMGLAVLLVLTSLAVSLLALALTAVALILAWRTPKAWLIAALIALVALAPLPANIAIFRGIVAYRHLELEG